MSQNVIQSLVLYNPGCELKYSFWQLISGKCETPEQKPMNNTGLTVGINAMG